MNRYHKNLILTALLVTSSLTFQGTIWAMDELPPMPAQSVPEEVSPEEYERRVVEFLRKLNSDGQFMDQISEYKNDIIKLNAFGIIDSQLTNLPKEIGNLIELKHLFLSDNQLTSLPKEMGKLKALSHVELLDNQLTSLPKEIGNLKALTRLYLDNNQLTSVPKEIGDLPNLTILTLINNPILPRGENENMWGREELRRHFGDRVTLDGPQAQKPMPANTALDQVYQQLDSQPLHINRATFINAKLPEIPGKIIEDGDEFLIQFGKLLTTLNFDQEDQPGYLSYDLLAGDFASDARNDQGSANSQKIFEFVIPRLTGYFRTLYGIPLEKGDTKGWQMYEENIPALKKALSYILTTLTHLEDPDQRASLFLQFVEGMLHCPTGQKEGIDTVILALLEGGKAQSSTDLKAILTNTIALKKNAFFKMAILAKGADNTQNVHLISTYQGLLKDQLGLTNLLNYKEKMGTFGQDPFSKNPNNVLLVFYQLVTPQRLVDWFLDKVQTPEDIALRQKLEGLSKERAASGGQGAPRSGFQTTLDNLRAKLESPETSETDKASILSRIKQLEGMIARQVPQKSVGAGKENADLKEQIAQLKGQIKANDLFHPITQQIIMTYLKDHMGVNMGQENWGVDYFSADPAVDQTATLTREGAMKILIAMGFVVSSGDKGK